MSFVRHAIRRLRRAPAFAIAAILTLGLGVGATVAVFSVVNGVLLRPLPYANADQLVDLAHQLQISGITHVDQADATYLYYRATNRVFTDVGAYQSGSLNVGGMVGGAADPIGTERIAAARVTPSVFTVLGARPARGRLFADRDDQPGAAPVVLVAERLWMRKYAGDPGIIGRSLLVDGVAREVIGIMPRGFHFPEIDADLWVPSGIDRAHIESATFDWRAVARLRPGMTLAAATADLNGLLPKISDLYPGRLTAQAIAATHMEPVIRPLRDIIVGDFGRVLWVVLGAVVFVLLAACANVANLFLARAEARWREMAVRRALGAGRGAMLGEFLSEGLVVAVAGGVLGIIIAVIGVQALRLLPLGGIELPRIGDIRVDAAVLLVAIGLTAFTALIVSVVPALRALTLRPVALVGGGRQMTTGRDRQVARSALVISQVAFALVLLAGAGVMVRSFARLRVVPPGFDPTGVLTFRVALPEATYRMSDDVARFHIRTLDALAATPGVASVGINSKLPLAPAGRSDTAVFVEDHPLEMGEIPGIHQVVSATPAYFASMRIPLVDGRLFEAPEAGHPALEAIVSRSFAERYWPGKSAIGRRIRTFPLSPWSTIVGVVGDVRGTALEQPPDQMLYVPLVASLGPRAERTSVLRDVAFVVRAAPGRDLATVSAAVRRAVRAIDPAVPTYDLRPMEERLAHASARTSSTLALLGLAAAAALTLGAVGIFGVVSYGVSLRRREIGIRLALGAKPSQVRGMVSRQAVAVCAVGVVAGLGASLALMRVLGALLYETKPTDPAVLAAAAAALLGVAIIASWAPASRAARVDPASALRIE
jgi:predicted permease